MKNIFFTQSITKRESDSISMLFRDIRKYDVLSPEEEEELAFRIADGDKEAVEKMVKHNIRFVIKVAKQYQSPGLELNDLINEGVFGLLEAIKRFDATKGYRFCTFAAWHIRKAIGKAIGEYGDTIRIPNSHRQQYYMLEKVKKEFMSSNSRQASYDELAEISGIDVDKIGEAETLPFAFCIDEPYGNDPEGLCWGDVLPSETRADAAADHESLVSDIQRVLNKLSESERNVLRMSFGFGQDFESSVEAIADRLGISEERVRQIRAKALTRIRLDKDSMSSLAKYAA